MENFQKMEHKYPIMFMIPNYQKKKKRNYIEIPFHPPKGQSLQKRKLRTIVDLDGGKQNSFTLLVGKKLTHPLMKF